jgi:hypothetical protein
VTGPREGSILGRYAPPDDGDHVTVTLLNFPLQVFAKARTHHDELMREFALLAFAPPQERPGHAVPAALLDLVQTLGVRYAGIGERTDARRDEALDRGELSMDLSYVVPRSVGTAMRELDDLMTKADAFCRSGDMLTLAATPLEVDFRAWFLQEFTNQSRGEAPTAWGGPLQPDA